VNPDAGPGNLDGRAEAPALLSTHGLVKRYRTFELGAIDLELRPARTYGLLGMNGAGKTTLLNCLSNQCRLHAGAVRWMGREVRWGESRFKEHVAVVREVPALYDELDARQHLRFASRIFERWDHGFAERWLATCRLDPRLEVRAYSKGMRVKLSLVIGLAHRPRVLLLDEPTAGLDPDTKDDLLGLLATIRREEDASILMSSHVFGDLEAVTTDVILLHEGRLRWRSTMEGIRGLRVASGPPGTLPAAWQVVRRWTDSRGSHALLQPPAAAGPALAASDVRPATLGDVYFAFTRGS
jgi:ABC-2 type transport system ATP-binding protein